ncbi:MAG: hypothetical protein ACK5PB_07730 [Pirellula sp.]|jgi:hypothetical protein
MPAVSSLYESPAERRDSHWLSRIFEKREKSQFRIPVGFSEKTTRYVVIDDVEVMGDRSQ